MSSDGDLQRQAADSTTPLEVLADLAYRYPALRATIASNPATYAGLLEWLAQIGDPGINAALAERERGVNSEQFERPASHHESPADPETAGSGMVSSGSLRPGVALSISTPVQSVRDPGPEEPSARKERHPRKKMMLTLVAAGIVAVLTTIAVVAFVVVPQRQLADAHDDFTSVLADLVGAQESIEQDATQASELLTTTSRDSVADASTLDMLKKSIDEAQQVDTSVLIGSETVVQLRAQIDELNQRYTKLDRLRTELTARSEAVRDSVHDLKIQAVTSRETHSITVTDGNGNKQRISISIGSWVKGSDSSLLDEAWTIVGGEGPMPIRDRDGFTASDGAFVFGTVSIENLTTDFPAKNFANGNSWAYLSPLIRFDGFFTKWHGPEFEGMGTTMQARQYSSGVQSDTVSGANPLIRADMSTDRWGPAPFAIGLGTIFTPKYPEGNPKFDEIVFSLGGTFGAKIEGDTSFTVGRSW